MSRRNSMLFAILMLLAPGQILLAAEWPIFCKGPISVTFKKGLTGFLTSSSLIIEFTFRNPQKAAGQRFENLSAGECSWPDRALRGGENTCLALTYNSNVESEFSIEYQLTPSGELKPYLRIIGGGMSDRISSLKQTDRKSKIYIDGGWPGCGKVTRIETIH